jgi:hypothetical protein
MALTLAMFILAFVSWAIDLRMLWLDLFVLLPQLLSTLPPSDDDFAAALKMLSSRLELEFTQLCCWIIIVRCSRASTNHWAC